MTQRARTRRQQESLMNPLPYELARMQENILGHASQLGLDFYTTIFEVIDYDRMNEVASYQGFPTRYPHWRWGMEYERMAKSYSYGLHKIYELVINNDPCFAYLLEGNSLIVQKLVMAHVYGHCDFFKNNASFDPTNRKAVDMMANHASRVRRYVDRHGVNAVEDFIDVCLSIENLIDVHLPHFKRPTSDRRPAAPSFEDDDEGALESVEVPRINVGQRKYMESFMNPPDYMEAQRKKMEAEAQRKRLFPEEPYKDVMQFLIEHAPLEKWERATLEFIREEALYFAPQRQTKIMNEGWASYWHSKIMTEHALEDDEIIDYADTHSGTMAISPGQLNPYKLGLELWRHVEERWDKGQFGREWQECDRLEEKLEWDKRLGLGRQKIFQVRRIYNDLTFLDEFLTPEFAVEQKLFTYGYNKKSGQWEVFSREFEEVKKKMLAQLTNFGQPFIYVEDGNFENRGELLLWHKPSVDIDPTHGKDVEVMTDLRKDYARDTLHNVQKIWRRPVHIHTIVDGKPRLWTHNGTDFKETVWAG